MKHTYIILGSFFLVVAAACMHVSIRADAVSDWFNSNISKPFERDVIKPFERDVIKPTEQAFVTVGKEIEKAFIDLGTILEKQVLAPVVSAGDVLVGKLKDCSNVVALGSEWAAKKSAYEAAQAGLIVTQQMNEMGPVQYGVYATQQAALLGLDAGKLGAEGLAHMVEGLGAIIGGGVNITEAVFDAQAQDLVIGKLPLFTMKGIFLGKPFDIRFQFDVNNPEKSFDAVVKELIKLVPGVS